MRGAVGVVDHEVGRGHRTIDDGEVHHPVGAVAFGFALPGVVAIGQCAGCRRRRAAAAQHDRADQSGEHQARIAFAHHDCGPFAGLPLVGVLATSVTSRAIRPCSRMICR
ncbi:hypothetical protein SDC9_197360 [bioreactor metagenome]|uniref:Uncharacterized protein n=1 Tax=bioreactor metagenome TaxID=1076179 RepID=A0A645IEJ1_9ZZZZ